MSHDRNSNKSVVPLHVVLREEADECENACELSPVHDICELCELAGLLRSAADEIEHLRAALEEIRDEDVPAVFVASEALKKGET